LATLKPGDTVIVTEREQTPADIKSGLYYPHFANMRGTILKIYGEEVSVTIDRDSLPDSIRKRHETNEKAERTKYLDRLSEVAKSALADKEKNFLLGYTVLVGMKDIALESKEAAAKRLTAKELDEAEEAFLNSRKS
jgi:hypothetical protein